MQQRCFGRIVNITSAMVKSPRPHMALSSTARTGLTAFAKALSLDVASNNVTINQLLPERIDSPRQAFMTERVMKSEGLSREDARARITDTIAAKRFGRQTSLAMHALIYAAFKHLLFLDRICSWMEVPTPVYCDCRPRPQPIVKKSVCIRRFTYSWRGYSSALTL